VVALTDRAAEHLRSFSSRVCVIPSGIDPPQQLSDRSVAAENKRIVGAGRLEAEKGFDRLVEAFAHATATSPGWKLVIYGEGSLRQALQDRCAALGIDRRVEFPGWVSPLQPELAKATIFCLSSRYEGFPSVLLEAMSMGVPAISVDCESGPRKIIDHGLNGLLVEPTASGLADGLARWIRDADHRETLAKAGRNVLQRYSFDAMTDQYEALLNRVVEERRNDW
jgi:glycosyltransferase involved in cell wall biosynthesis